MAETPQNWGWDMKKNPLSKIPPTLQAEWENFEKAAMHLDCPDYQRREMKKAFFSGALVFYMHVEAAGHRDVSDAESLQHIADIGQECADFARDYIKRYVEKN